MSIHVQKHYDAISVRGFESATGGEEKFIRDNIMPKIKEGIECHKGQLRADAIARIQAGFNERIEGLRASVDVLQVESMDVVRKLENGVLA